VINAAGGQIRGRAFASAVADGTVTGNATATARPWIITQQAYATNLTDDVAWAFADVTNAGNLTLTGLATAHGLTAAASVDFVTGPGGIDAIEQRVNAVSTGVATAVGEFDNSGSLWLFGFANAFSPLGDSGTASATVNLSWFIDQWAEGRGTDPLATLRITNDGLIYGSARAVASGSNALIGEAQARGIRQEVQASTLSQIVRAGTGQATFINNGTLSAIAFGQAIGGTNADAEADASGIQQRVFAGDLGVASVQNDGVFNIFAHAVATATTGDALAQVNGGDAATGIDQTVQAFIGTGVTGVGSALIANTGSITVVASAEANGAFNAWADASATGITQDVTAGAEGVARFANNIVGAGTAAQTGVLNVTANAVAHVVAVTGTYTQTYPGNPNTQTYTLTGNQPATIASADARAVGITQDVFAGLTATVSVVNSGSINVNATADASITPSDFFDNYTGNSALASAVAIGILQDVDAGRFTTVGNIALARFDNNAGAELNVNASAFADGDTARASASALGIAQDVGTNDQVLNASALVTNDGVINVHAQASATGVGYYAYTEARASATAVGIYQSVEGNTAGLASVANAATIDVAATARAIGLDTTDYGSAYASANAFAEGIVQIVGADGDFADPVDGPTGHATAQIINSGLIEVDALASANAEGQPARASATASGVFQDAGAATNGGASTLAQAIFQNVAVATPASTGVLDVSAHAVAVATASDATAAAYVDGIFQDAGAFNGDALASVVNAGDILVAANATATADSYAGAYATGTGIHQRALAFQFTGAETVVNADALLDNDGLIDIGGSANADGSQGIASAYFEGIDQTAVAFLNIPGGTATGGAAAVASVDNAGTITVHAGAYGPDAFVGVDVIDQVAFAFADGTSAVGLAQVLNAATIVGNATATASGDDPHAGAQAFAIAQDAGAYAASDADGRAIVANGDGATISAVAVANASGTALGEGITARAEATASGIAQDAGAAAFATLNTEAVATAIASLTNSGVILASAAAFAFGSNAGAQADAFGIFQDAGALVQNDTAVASAQALIENTGEISVLAEATGFGITNGYANAEATGIAQHASAIDLALASVVNTSLATINVAAAAAANGNVANADAYAAGIFQDAGAATSGDQDPIAIAAASAIVNNAGAISVDAEAIAEGADAWAQARGIAIDQSAQISFYGETGSSSVALVSVLNSGTIEFGASASAAGGNIATALAYGSGIDQDVGAEGNPGSVARARVDNSGAINVANTAVAEADVLGFARAQGGAIRQEVWGAESLFAEVFNGEDNEITITNSASAVGYRATAQASATGIEQDVQGYDIASQAAVLTVDNGGTISVEAIAVAEVNNTVLDFTSHASATARAIGISQSAYNIGSQTDTDFNPTGSLRETVVNDGELNVHASASASGGNGNFAVASAAGVLQDAGGQAQEFALTVLNSGTIDVAATGVADGDGDGEAFANAAGIWQSASGNYGADGGYTTLGDNIDSTVAQVAVLSVDNTGDIVVVASASAAGDGEVVAGASAVGIRQEFNGFGDSWGESPAEYGYADVTAIVNNVGHIDVSAVAVADGGDTNAAYAGAVGIEVEGGGYAVLNLDLFNSGTSIKVFASASADGGDASAYAVGIDVYGGQIQNVAATTNNPVVGIVNEGLIRAEAVATGDYGFASAAGINVFAFTEFRGSITNDGGTIIALASGSSAHAVGIRIAEPTAEYNAGGTQATDYETRTDYGEVSTGVGEINIIDSTIFAGVTNDGGLSLHRGTAIDVVTTPNPIIINLEGPVDIFGNILISSNDEVNIDGSLFLDGSINPGTSALAAGVVNLGAGATLTLANNATDGPAFVNVGVFNQDPDAVVVFELRGDDNSDAPNSAGSIFAATSANLDGTAVVRLLTGLYDDTTFTSVVVAGTINGEWDNVVLDRDYLFFDIEATSVQNNGTFDYIDLVLNRTPFDGVSGLTPNQAAVAGGLENAYSPTLSGGFGDLVQNLLFQTSGATFADYLQQLSGVEHGQKVHAELQAQNILKDIVTQQLQTVPEIGMRGEGFQLNSVWVAGFGSWGNMDGNESAGGYDSNVYGIVGGIDFKVGSAGKVGGTIGYASGNLDFDNYNNDADYSGFNLGLYGRYDLPQVYFQAVGSYGMYDNEVTRNIDIGSVDGINPHRTLLHPDAGVDFNPYPGLAATSGTAASDYSSDVWQLYGEVGYKADFGANFSIVPFAGINWMYGESDAFLEAGAAGADLDVEKATGRSLASLLGVRLTGNNMLSGNTTLIPHARIAWEHEFLDQIWSVQAAFAGDPLSGYHVRGLGYSQDSALVGVGVNIGFQENMLLKLGYDGRFGGDRTDHTVIAKLTFLFGAAPPPPPPPPPI
jgi:uncharacterized protein with beta-barrel porin domain